LEFLHHFKLLQPLELLKLWAPIALGASIDIEAFCGDTLQWYLTVIPYSDTLQPLDLLKHMELLKPSKLYEPRELLKLQ
jgi:hypothetical protein